LSPVKLVVLHIAIAVDRWCLSAADILKSHPLTVNDIEVKGVISCPR
jgi:hypothetical protein